MTAQDSRTRESKAPDPRLWLQGWLAQKAGDRPEHAAAGGFLRDGGSAPEHDATLGIAEERILALPDDVLRGFSAAYLDSLPERVRQTVDARLTGLHPPPRRDRGALDERDEPWVHVVPPDTRPEELHRLLETIPAEDVLVAFRRRQVVRFFGIENILRYFADDEVVRHYAPAERLAGLSREEQILAMPDQVLHGLTEEFVRTLPGHARQAIQARLVGDS